MTRTLGIVGGQGPLASAEFLSTLYRLNLREPEQEMPVCVLVSDPTFPDRTELIRQGREEVLEERLRSCLESLLGLGATTVVIACFSLHTVLDRMPAALRARVVSLVDVALEEAVRRREPQLLLCTTGARIAGLFERHPLWSEAAPFLAQPDAASQEQVHTMIYRLKRGDEPEGLAAEMADLLGRHGVASFLAGCTEFHLLTRCLERRPQAGAPRFIDPLTTLAGQLDRYLGATGR